MTDFYNRSTPVAQAKFRDNTEKRNMLGVAAIPRLSLCCKCGVRRTTETGRTKKSGAFVCHGCGKK